MTATTELTQALRHVREIGGNPSIRVLLVNALGHRTNDMKHELRMVGLGCGDDHVADQLESTLQEEGLLLQ